MGLMSEFITMSLKLLDCILHICFEVVLFCPTDVLFSFVVALFSFCVALFTTVLLPALISSLTDVLKDVILIAATLVAAPLEAALPYCLRLMYCLKLRVLPLWQY
jgi:hypothetical protein